MPVFTIEFEPAFYEALREHAKAQGKPLAKLVRAWCTEALNPSAPKTTPEPTRNQVGRPKKAEKTMTSWERAFDVFTDWCAEVGYGWLQIGPKESWTEELMATVMATDPKRYKAYSPRFKVAPEPEPEVVPIVHLPIHPDILVAAPPLEEWEAMRRRHVPRPEDF